jgi:hypothetical protein
METTFEDKVAYVATSFYRRFDDSEEGFDATNEYPSVLRTIFNRHDMAGPLALALFNGDIELKGDNSKNWIEESYGVLVSVFGDPSTSEEEIPETPELEVKPKKAVAKKSTKKPE